MGLSRDEDARPVRLAGLRLDPRGARRARFKDPLGVNVHSFAEQFRMLTEYVARHTKNGRK